MAFQQLALQFSLCCCLVRCFHDSSHGARLLLLLLNATKLITPAFLKNRFLTVKAKKICYKKVMC